jgi:hypothetical protein
VPAQFDRRQLEEDRISAVHYLRFRLSPAQAASFGDPAQTVALRVDHRNYTARAVLAEPVRCSLAVDLSGDPKPVHRFRPRATSAEPRVLVTRGRVRAVEVDPERVVVEAVPPAPPFTELADDLASELLSLARAIAADWLRAGRASELTIDSAGPHARIEIRARI